MSPRMFCMESPGYNHCIYFQYIDTGQLTVVFSRCPGVVLDSLQYEIRVPNEFPDELNKNGGHEAKDPVPDVVSSPEEVEDKAEDEQAEGVGV